MGRIKVVIAEGISHGPPGTTPFEKTRNLVAFSFQHTPLRESRTSDSQANGSDAPIIEILEESGIAWPNPGMFYQIQHQDLNPLSPRKDKDPDPDSHAHSPRHRTPPTASAKLDSMVLPPNFSYGMMQAGMLMPPPSFGFPGPQVCDPFLPQYSHNDPFSGIGEHVYRRRFLQDYTRQTSSSGDVSMQDAPPKSRSTISDQPMLDYVRPHSAVSSYKSYPMNDYPRPLSPEGRRSFSLLLPPNPRLKSPAESRHVSTESLRGPRMQRLFSEIEAQGDHETLLPEHSQFAEMFDAMSPRRVLGSGYYPPANTRVSSATNTPPATSRSSAAAEARALSYSGKSRSVSNTTRDLPPPTHSRSPSEIAPRARTKSRKSDSRQSEIGDEPINNPQKVVKKALSTNVKSRKENRANETGREDTFKFQRTVSSGSTLVQDKENVGTLHPSGGDSKRRRVSSSNVSQGTPLVAQSTIQDTPTKTASNNESRVDSPNKINEIDDLTAEGVVVRAPLEDTGNLM